MNIDVPPYFDYLIDGFHHGATGRFVHLGHWDHPPTSETKLTPDEFKQAQLRLNEVLLNMARLHDGLDILDVGCGFGGTLESINEQYHDCQLTGVNIDPRQLKICEQLSSKDNNSYAWGQADACQLPFSDESFDRVLCIEAMFHFSSRLQFFKEVSRVLRPGGILVGSDIIMHADNLTEQVTRRDVEAAIKHEYGPWPDLWSANADHAKLAANTSLNCIEIYDATLNTYPSHRFTAPEGAIEPNGSHNNAVNAAIMLRRLHSQKIMRYWYMRFDKS